jgi:hypothetical protein
MTYLSEYEFQYNSDKKRGSISTKLMTAPYTVERIYISKSLCRNQINIV